MSFFSFLMLQILHTGPLHKCTHQNLNPPLNCKIKRHILNRWSKQAIWVYIKETYLPPNPCWASCPKCPRCCTFRTMTDRAQRVSPHSKLCPFKLGFNLTQPPVRLVRTWVHRGRAGLHYRMAGSGPVLSLCFISLPLYFSVPCRHGTEMGASSLVLHVTPFLLFVIFHMRWSPLWNEMSFPKMKYHKSSVINLLVRLLQLSPVEDIWTSRLTNASNGAETCLSHNRPYSQPFSGLLKALLTVWNGPFLGGN